MHFSLVKINPPDTPPSHGFDDVILPAYHALKRLGYRAEILFNAGNPHSRNIVFGSCIAPRRVGRSLPRGSIIFNLEQITGDNAWSNRDYLAHLHEFSVWDYSPRNIETLLGLGIKGVQHVPLGYVPEMTRLNGKFSQDIDVLFYGTINERRHVIIKRLCDAGVKVIATQNAFGDLRDNLLSRSRVLLHVHHYIPASLEQVRLGYVWANRKAVAAEWREDTEMPPHLADACAYFPYDSLVDGVRRLLADAALRGQYGQKGFDSFASVSFTETLASLVGRRVFPAGGGKEEGGGVSPAHRPYHLSAVKEWVVKGGPDPAGAVGQE